MALAASSQFCSSLARGATATPPARTIVVTGESVAGATIANAANVQTGDDGHAAVQVSWSGPPSGAAVLVQPPGGGGRLLIGRTGEDVPEGGGKFLQIQELSAGGGYTAFRSVLAQTAGSDDTRGVYVFDGSALRTVVRSGTESPGGGGAFQNIGPGLKVTAGGHVGFQTTVLAGNAARGGVYLKPADGPLRKLLLTGSDGIQTINGDWVLNDAGQLAGGVSMDDGKPALVFHDGVSVARVAKAGEPLPEGDGKYVFFSAPSLNNAGRVAYGAAVTTSAADPARNRLYVRSASVSTKLHGEDDPAPGGGTFGYFGAPVMNDADQVAFHSLLADERSGIYRTDANGHAVLIARSDQPRPEGGGALGRLSPVADYVPHSSQTAQWMMPPAMNDSGVVAFVAYDGVFNTSPGIYLGDGIDTVLVARHGYALEGSTITQFKWPDASQSSPPGSGPLTVTERGEVAYTVKLADNRVVAKLFTPTLAWRGGAAGAWSEAANWTLGLAPAAVHPVKIDSPHGVNVTTPAGQTSVKSLEVGVGNKLTLTPGSDLTVSDGVTLHGTLAGSGTIHGDVVNAGVIAPGNSVGAITIDGDLAQSGDLVLELLGDAHDQLIVDGAFTLGGDIFVTGSGTLDDTFDLIVADALSGSATWHLPGESTYEIVTLPGGGGQALRVTYVPEPAGGAVIIAAACAAAVGRRRRAPKDRPAST